MEVNSVTSEFGKTTIFGWTAEDMGRKLYNGYLEKKKSVTGGWVKRWFVLTERCLVYYEDPTETEVKGIIPLVNSTCFSQVYKKEKYKALYFNIRTKTSDTLLRAEDMNEKRKWIDHLKGCCVPGELSLDERRHLANRQGTFKGLTKQEEEELKQSQQKKRSISTGRLSRSTSDLTKGLPSRSKTPGRARPKTPILSRFTSPIPRRRTSYQPLDRKVQSSPLLEENEEEEF